MNNSHALKPVGNSELQGSARFLSRGLGSLLLAALMAFPASASPPQFGVAVARGDFDADGFEDLAVGVPGELNRGGQVDVYYGTSGGLATVAQTWDQDVPGISGIAEPDDIFGFAVATGDFNGDGYSDLVAGVPGEDIGSIVAAGAVNVIYGSVAGLSSTGNWLWHQDSSGISGAAEAGDEFGHTLATGDFNGDGYDDLAVGVRGEDVLTVADTGMVNIIYGSAAGLDDVGNAIWHQDRAGMQEQNELGDEFGAALSSGDFDRDGYDDLAIGVPGESFEHKGPDGVEAGRISIMFGSATGLAAARNDVFHLDRGSILGVAGANDRYGTSVAAGDFNGEGTDDLAVGAPGNDWGAVGAGSVNVLYFFSNAPGSFATQTRVQGGFSAGTPETGDLFGYSLTAGNFDGDSREDLAIGVPGEGVGSIAACGATHVLYGSNSGLQFTGDQLWHQDSTGIQGKCENADLAGISLTAGDFDNDGNSELVIGVPFENNSSGVAHVILGSSSGLTSTGNLLLP